MTTSPPSPSSAVNGGMSRSRTNASASTVAVGSNETAVDSPASYRTAIIDASVTEVDPDRPPGIDRRTPVDLPRREDRVGDALVGQEPQRVEVDRGLGQPHAGRSPPEPELEVAQPPADLGPSIGGARQRQDGVVERLRHPVRAAVAVDEAA